jgi:acetyl esterase/lipase
MRVTNEMIDPQLRLPGRIMRWLVGEKHSVESMRRDDMLFLKLFKFVPLFGMRQEQRWIPRPDGSRLRIKIYKPRKPIAHAPAMLWLHGGGYSAGNPEGEVVLIRQLVEIGHCLVVTPDYRLSKVAPYPAALDDCYLALRWLKDHVVELGGRSDQIIVGGASAGGGLTAAVTLYARDQGEVRIAFQMPICPMIDDRGMTASAIDNDAPVYDSVTNDSNWRIYLGDLYGGDVPIYAAPARATDLSGLPPTISFVGDIEPFCDETVAYVEGLRAAGVPTEFNIYPGAYHGFHMLAPWARISRQANAWFYDRYRDALQSCFAEQQP